MKKFTKKIIPLISLLVFINLFLISFIIMPSFVEIENVGVYLYIGLVLLLLLISIIYAILYQKTSEYEFQEKGVHVRSGVLFRKKSYLEYKNMHAINYKQNLLEKIFGTARLMLDSGSTNTGSKAEIIIYESIDVVNNLMLKLESKDNINSEIKEPIINDEEHINLFNYSSKLKAFNVLIDSLNALFIIIIILGAISLASILINVFSKDGFIYDILIGLTLLFLFIIILYSVVNFIRIFVHFYNFKLYKNEKNNSLEINYGLLTTFHHNFKLDRIKAVIIKQPFIYMLFGYATISLEVIGYDEDNDNNTRQDSYLIPICKLEDCDEIIKKCVGEFSLINKEKTCKSYFSLISWTLLTYLLLYISSIYIGYLVLNALDFNQYLLMFILTDSLLFLVISIVTLIAKYLAYKFEGIGIDKDKTTIYHGGFNRYRTTLLNKYIIGVTSVTTPLRNKKGIYSYNIHIKTNAVSNVYRVDIVDKDIRDNLLNVVKY